MSFDQKNSINYSICLPYSIHSLAFKTEKSLKVRSKVLFALFVGPFITTFGVSIAWYRVSV